MTDYEYPHESGKTFTTEEKERRYKYLGKEVLDVGAPGLDSIPEFYGIANAIWRDWKDRKIDTKTALRRLALLKLLTYKGKNKKIQHIPDHELEAVRAFIDYVRAVIKSGSVERGEPEEQRSE
ncbi:MAG: hypothetical protein GXN93_03500 [Candidatus Diapherotrites archaeon]|nr:hypothetical protein [Candidatus Diapherotrites archaeon]